jgi:transposase
LIQIIPGISKVSASAILAEIGADMSQFPDAAHLSSGRAFAQEITRVLERKRGEKHEKEISF